jgi:ribosome-associated heat shock protein Hsp15
LKTPQGAALLASTRLDKWLWAARFFKTRSLAQDAIESGRVLLNSQRAKAAKEVRPDDLIDIRISHSAWTVRVRFISDVRASAGVAQTLYAETEQSMLAREAAREQQRLAPEPAARRARSGAWRRGRLVLAQAACCSPGFDPK